MEDFTPLDFLSNDLFVKWHLTKDEELEAYWADFIAGHPQCREAFESAVMKLGTLRINSHELTLGEKDALRSRIANTLEARRRRRKNIGYSVAAASAAVIVSAFLLFPSGGGKAETRNTIIGQLMPPADILLRVGDEVVSIDDNAEISLTDKGVLSIHGEEGMQQTERNVKQSTVNKLITPNGKRSTIVLPDGSKVWVNSGSELEFSSDFSRERIINVSGEVYVEVFHDKTRPFMVSTSDMTVRVHGTKFNVNAYRDESVKSVVLIEGEVEVSHAGRSQLMKPNGMFSVDDGKTDYRIVGNADSYVTWINGVLTFENTKISQVLEKVGRYYNIEFRTEKSPVMAKTCSGKLILTDNLEDILQSIRLISGVEFEYTGNVVYMKAKRE